MRIPVLVAAVCLMPMLGLADLSWHKFGVSGGDTNTIRIDRLSLSITTREVREAAFREDYLVLTVHHPGQNGREYWFTSSYGFGEIAVQGDLLLLRYGVGRGTLVRVEHVRVLRLASLDELVDVQSTYYVLTDPKESEPELVRYRLRIQTESAYTTLIFTLPAPRRGLPSEKIVTLKHDA